MGSSLHAKDRISVNQKSFNKSNFGLIKHGLAAWRALAVRQSTRAGVCIIIKGEKNEAYPLGCLPVLPAQLNRGLIRLDSALSTRYVIQILGLLDIGRYHTSQPLFPPQLPLHPPPPSLALPSPTPQVPLPVPTLQLSFLRCAVVPLSPAQGQKLAQSRFIAQAA